MLARPQASVPLWWDPAAVRWAVGGRQPRQRPSRCTALFPWVVNAALIAQNPAHCQQQLVDEPGVAIRHFYPLKAYNYSAPEAVYTCLDAVGGDLEAAAGCLAPDDYADAILALDLGSGAIQWGQRLQSFDVWSAACGVPLFNPPPLDTCRSPDSPDYDFGTGANLF